MGVTGSVSSVRVDFTAVHSYIGDLDVQLIAPNATVFTIFKFVGRTSASNRGFATNLGGTYTFTDQANNSNNNLWIEAGASTDTNYIIPGGLFRTQGGGPFTSVNPGPAFTSLNAAFAGITSPNGVWTLRFLDCAAGGNGGDTGSVSAATLTILGGLDPTSAPASVSGRAYSEGGRGIRNLRVSLTGGDLSAPFIRAHE